MAYTTPPTFVSGDTLTAAQMNTYVRDNFKALGDPWTAYTPALTNWTLGNGTLTGAFMQVNATVMYRISYTGGSTTTESGNLVISLPTTSIVPANFPMGQATLLDASPSATRHCSVRRGGSANLINVCFDDGTVVNATNPWTWTTSDQILISGHYEAAV